MPRLTNAEFLERHYFLLELWNDARLQSLFGSRSVNEQMDLHQYYQTLNYGNDAELVKTRTTVNSGDESLAQRAGRVYAKLVQSYADGARVLGVVDLDNLVDSVRVVSKALERQMKMQQAPKPKPYTSSSPKGKHHLVAIVKPNIDKEALAKLLLDIVREKPIPKQSRSRATMRVPNSHASTE